MKRKASLLVVLVILLLGYSLQDGRVMAKMPTYKVVANWPEIPSGMEVTDYLGIATDAQGQVYIAAKSNGIPSILVFSQEGELLTAWGI